MTKESPLWASNPSIESYGGHPDLHDYLDLGPIDPTTDTSADNYNSMTSDVSKLARTGVFARMGITISDGYTVAVDSFRSFIGIGTSQAPTVSAFNSVITITFSPTYTDEFEQEAAISLGAGYFCPLGTTPFVAVIEPVNVYTLKVRLFNLAGTALNNKSFTLDIVRTV